MVADIERGNREHCEYVEHGCCYPPATLIVLLYYHNFQKMQYGGEKMAQKITIDVEARFVDNVTGQANSASSAFDKLEMEA